MRNIAIIPARGGSKRLPGKNILPLGGIPLIAHSILYAQANSDVDAVYVSTDDEKIRRTALEFGAEIIDRPAAISGDKATTAEALQHALGHCGGSVGNVFLLQPTNPLRPSNLLAECFETFKERQADSLFTVSRNHQKFGKIDAGKFVPFNYKPGQRSQDLEPLYFENGLLYICKAEVIANGEIITENAVPFETDPVFSAVDIDTQADFDYAEYLYQKLSITYNP